MPVVNKLFDPSAISGNAAPAGQPRPEQSKEKQTITAADVGMVPAGLISPNPTFGSGQNMQEMFDQSKQETQEALIQSKSGGIDFKALVARMTLPSYLQQAMPEVADRELTGYIGFCSDASKHYQEQTNAGLKNGQIFLKHQGQYIGLEQLDFFIANGSSFRSVMESTGAFSFVTRNMELKTASISYPTGPGRPPRIVVKDTQPHYICLCFVNVHGKLVPIKGDFIGTKSGGMESAIRAVESAGKPESGWDKISDAHKITMAFPHPFGRVIHFMRTKYEVAKGTGLPYFRTVTVSQPASIPQMQMLIGHLADEDFVHLMNEAYQNYQSRVAFMDTLANPQPQQQASQHGSTPTAF